MSLVVAVLAVGLAVGWLAGGSLTRLGDLPLRAPRLVVAALLAQLAGTLVGGPLYPVGLVASAVLVTLFLTRNVRLAGVPLVALGLLLNAVVVGANGAMPVSQAAAARAGVPLTGLIGDPRHELSDARTRLSWLADVVPVPLPVRAEVVSPGDVLVAAGLVQLVVAGMLRRRRVALTVRADEDVCNPDGRRRRRRSTHGQEGSQAPRAQEERRQPRQAPERLSRS